MVAALVMFIAMAALGTRTSQGFLASVFQGVNREARDVAESAITDFAVTLNREENRRLLVAGNDQLAQWSTNAAHRNPCSGQFQASKYVTGTAAATSAGRFQRSDTWQNLVSGDSSRQFLVEDVRYRYENRTAGSERTDYTMTTLNANIPTHTVRNAALQGGTRTLLRVTIQGRVQRNGQESRARVTREFEVVPKCCKRSFGRHSGLGGAESDPAWGTDPVLECPLFLDDGAGRGVIGSLSGGQPAGSNNTLNITDERNNLITRALCWGGDLSGGSDLTGTPNPDCLNGLQTLGKATKSQPGVTFVPIPFDLVLPRPRFGDGTGSGFDGGWVHNYIGTPSTAILNALLPQSTFGNWVTARPSAASNAERYWMKTYGAWHPFAPGSSAAKEGTPSFAGCSGAANIGACRSEPFMGAAPYPRADTQPITLWPEVFPQQALSISANSTIYLDPGDAAATPPRPMAMKIVSGGGAPQTLDTCIVSKEPAAAYAVADCRFRSLTSGNQTLTIDTTYAMINLHFDDTAFSGEYMGGNGNTAIRRVHCSRTGYTPGSCSDVETWADFQLKCDPAAGAQADPNCSVRNNFYDHSELFNAFAFGAGTFTLNGTSATVGVNVYAPRATVSLIGGGNAVPNFMGRIWTNNITITGNTSVRTPVSHPSFCTNHPCPPPAKVPLYDLIARSFSHASGF